MKTKTKRTTKQTSSSSSQQSTRPTNPLILLQGTYVPYPKSKSLAIRTVPSHAPHPARDALYKRFDEEFYEGGGIEFAKDEKEKKWYVNLDLDYLGKLSSDLDEFLRLIWRDRKCPQSVATALNSIAAPPHFDGMAAQDKRIATPLRTYQREAVTWMAQREQNPTLQWEASTFLPVELEEFASHGGNRPRHRLMWSPYFCMLVLEADFAQVLEEVCKNTPEDPCMRGGLFLDEMGLGKSLAILALVLARPRPAIRPFFVARAATRRVLPSKHVVNCLCCLPSVTKLDLVPCPGTCNTWHHSECYGGLNTLCVNCLLTTAGARPSAGTLIVSPQTIVGQWEEEILKHIVPGGLKYVMVESVQVDTKHLQDAIKDKNMTKEKIEIAARRLRPQWLSQFDIIITAYETLSKDLDFLASSNSGRQSKAYPSNRPPLSCLDFYRTVLDESQLISNSRRRQSVNLIPSIHQWAVTGTPMKDSLEDLFPLLNFVKHPEFGDDANYWELASTYTPLGDLLRDCLWRNTKRTIASEMQMPAIVEDVKLVDLSVVEFLNYEDRAQSSVELPPKIRVMQLRHAAIHPSLGPDGLSFVSHRQRRHGKNATTTTTTTTQDASAIAHNALANLNTHTSTTTTTTIKPAPPSGSLSEMLTQMISNSMIAVTELRREKVMTQLALAAYIAAIGSPTEEQAQYRQVLHDMDEFDTHVMNDASDELKSDLYQRIHATYWLLRNMEAQSGGGNHDTLRKSLAELEARFLQVATMGEISSKADFDKVNATVHPFNNRTGLETLMKDALQVLHDEDMIESLATRIDQMVHTDYSRPLHVLQNEFMELDERQVDLKNTLDSSTKKRADRVPAIQAELNQVKAALSAIPGRKAVIKSAIREKIAQDVQVGCVDIYQKNDNLVTSAKAPLDTIGCSQCTRRGDAKCTNCVWGDALVEYGSSGFASGGEPQCFRIMGVVADVLAQIRTGNVKRLKDDKASAASSSQHRTGEVLVQKLRTFANEGSDQLNKQWQAMTTLWRARDTLVKRMDELAQAKSRLRVRVGGVGAGNVSSSSDDDGVGPAIVNMSKHEVEGLMHVAKTDVDRLTQEEKAATSRLTFERSLHIEECGVCFDALDEIASSVLECGHVLCEKCAKKLVSDDDAPASKSTKKFVTCPFCRKKTTNVKYTRKRNVESMQSGATTTSASLPRAPPRATTTISRQEMHGYGAKIEATAQLCRDVVAGTGGLPGTCGPNSKTLVFSEWEGVLDLLEKALVRDELHFVRGLHKRDLSDTIARFKTDSTINFLLMPFAYGANGLNLTEANRVIFMEPLLNRPVELQAVGRVHRSGQQSQQVVIHRIIARHTIEHVILKQVNEESGGGLDIMADSTVTSTDLGIQQSRRGTSVKQDASDNFLIAVLDEAESEMRKGTVFGGGGV